MKRNKTKKTPRGRTIIKKLKPAKGTPEVGEVGQGMPEVGNGVGFEVGEVGSDMYKPSPDWKWEVTPEPPSAWASWCKLLAGYGREIWNAARWFFALPLRALPDVAAPSAPVPVRDVPPLDSFQPAPAADVPVPADAPPAEIPADSALPIDAATRRAWAAPKTKRKPRRRKD